MSFQLNAQTAPFLETGGIVVFEAESVPADPEFWHTESSVEGFKGTGYIVGRINSFNQGGKGIIRYPVKISTTGRYQLSWRSRIVEGDSNTESNDSFARILDSSENFLETVPNENVKIGPDWYKVYMNRVGSWIHDASNKDNDPHSLSWNLVAGETYYFEVAARSRGHAVDRIILWNTDLHSFANKTTGKQSNNGALNDLAVSATEVADADNDGLPDSWEEQHGPDNVSIAQDSDNDKDGLSAAIEYTINSDPNVFTPLNRLQVDPSPGATKATYPFSLFTPSSQAFDLEFQQSSDLVNWTSDGVAIEAGASSGDENIENLEATVTLGNGNQPAFLRMRVTKK